MTYAERLQTALKRAGVTDKDLRTNLGISIQAVAKVLNGKTNAFTAENNAKAARYLGVDSFWLATGKGAMEPSEAVGGDFASLSPGAMELALLYDLIPIQDRIRRARAYNAASAAILDVAQSVAAKDGQAQGHKKQPV